MSKETKNPNVSYVNHDNLLKFMGFAVYILTMFQESMAKPDHREALTCPAVRYTDFNSESRQIREYNRADLLRIIEIAGQKQMWNRFLFSLIFLAILGVYFYKRRSFLEKFRLKSFLAVYFRFAKFKNEQVFLTFSKENIRGDKDATALMIAFIESFFTQYGLEYKRNGGVISFITKDFHEKTSSIFQEDGGLADFFIEAIERSYQQALKFDSDLIRLLKTALKDVFTNNDLSAESMAFFWGSEPCVGISFPSSGLPRTIDDFKAAISLHDFNQIFQKLILNLPGERFSIMPIEEEKFSSSANSPQKTGLFFKFAVSLFLQIDCEQYKKINERLKLALDEHVKDSSDYKKFQLEKRLVEQAESDARQQKIDLERKKRELKGAIKKHNDYIEKIEHGGLIAKGKSSETLGCKCNLILLEFEPYKEAQTARARPLAIRVNELRESVNSLLDSHSVEELNIKAIVKNILKEGSVSIEVNNLSDPDIEENLNMVNEKLKANKELESLITHFKICAKAISGKLKELESAVKKFLQTIEPILKEQEGEEVLETDEEDAQTDLSVESGSDSEPDEAEDPQEPVKIQPTLEVVEYDVAGFNAKPSKKQKRVTAAAAASADDSQYSQVDIEPFAQLLVPLLTTKVDPNVRQYAAVYALIHIARLLKLDFHNQIRHGAYLLLSQFDDEIQGYFEELLKSFAKHGMEISTDHIRLLDLSRNSFCRHLSTNAFSDDEVLNARDVVMRVKEKISELYSHIKDLQKKSGKQRQGSTSPINVAATNMLIILLGDYWNLLLIHYTRLVSNHKVINLGDLRKKAADQREVTELLESVKEVVKYDLKISDEAVEFLQHCRRVGNGLVHPEEHGSLVYQAQCASFSDQVGDLLGKLAGLDDQLFALEATAPAVGSTSVAGTTFPPSQEGGKGKSELLQSQLDPGAPPFEP